MGYRFYKSVSVGKGMRVGVSKSGLGVSAGVKGFRYSAHSSGRTRRTTTVSGTGLSHSSYGSSGRAKVPSRTAAPKSHQAPVVDATDLDRLIKASIFAPKAEKLYVAGVKQVLKGALSPGMTTLGQCVEADQTLLSAYFLAGYASLKLGDEPTAIRWLEPIVTSEHSLPDRLMTKYRLDGSLMSVALPIAITPSVTVEIEMSTLGTALLLAELYQENGQAEKAIGLLENIVDLAPESPVAALSLAELYAHSELWDEIVTMPARIENTDDLSAEFLRYKGGAMRQTGLFEGALEVLKECLKSKKRHPEILKAARYERGLTYEAMGKRSQAARDFERLFAEDAAYLDVAQKVSPTS